MRSVLVALLVSTTALLAGCSDDGGHEHDAYTCPDGTELDLTDFPDHDNETFNPLSKCPKTSGGNSTSSAPNVLPTLSLSVKDDGGNETLVTMLGGNLTFSAEGSTDSDGSITGIAVSVTDSNTTRTASLYDAAAKAFKPATFKFDRPGVVNVTIAMVDDRAGFSVNQSNVYVNHPQLVGTGVQITGPDPVIGGNDPCTGAEGDTQGIVGGTVVDSNYFKSVSFAIVGNATFVEATSTGGDLQMTICSPEGAPLSDEKVSGTVTTLPGTALPPAPGTTSYSVGVYASAPPQQSAEMMVVVHYEPQTAEAPAEDA